MHQRVNDINFVTVDYALDCLDRKLKLAYWGCIMIMVWSKEGISTKML